MTETLSEREVQIVGREAELALVDEFLAPESTGRALVLTGEAGIGKTTLWEAGVERGWERGLRVLSARASGAQTRLAFAALIDLFDGVESSELEGVPAPQLHALEVALLRAEPSRNRLPQAAISVGFLNALRQLSERQPLLIAIDDVQWLDRASLEAVAYAARRLAGNPARFLLAKRSRTSSRFERAYGPEGLRRLEIRPLSLGAIQRLLADRLGLSLTRHVLRRVQESTLGNPLFALELGRALAARGSFAIGEEVPLPDTVDKLLGIRVTALPPPVRRLVVAASLSGDLRVSQVDEIATQAALDEAVEAGVLAVDGNRVRPAHPLFATAARSRAGPGEQRELHVALARTARDEESRALHRAHAADHADEDLAAALAVASDRAAARGARHAAVVLAEHALRLTPPDADRTERLLALGEHLVAAGEHQQVTDLLSAEVDSLPIGPARGRALLLLTDSVVESNDEIRSYLTRAFAESGGDAPVQGRARGELAANDASILVARIPEAEASALEVLEAAPELGADLECYALYVLGWARAMAGRPIDDLCERFNATSRGAAPLTESPERLAGQRYTWRGEIEQARSLLLRLMETADERGEGYSYVLQRLHVCQLGLRVGDWSTVERLLDEWAESSERVMWPMYERCRALLAAGRGLPEEAERWAAKTLSSAQAVGTHWDRLEALRARGVSALLVGELGRAVDDLRAVWEHTQREGVDEPGVFPVAPDLVEALVELGELAEAEEVTKRLRTLSEEQEHPWGLTTATRCASVIALASDRYDEQAAAHLAEAADEYGALGLRFDRARSLLALGRAQRRLRKWALARESLDRAAAEFDELGSFGWADQVRAERLRVGGRRPQAAGELTETERRVVELAADGLANKEIAQSLFVSVRTVEVHLKHAYAKLGIRSRTQLARRLSERA